jgi:hypothetical protein
MTSAQKIHYVIINFPLIPAPYEGEGAPLNKSHSHYNSVIPTMPPCGGRE